MTLTITYKNKRTLTMAVEYVHTEEGKLYFAKKANVVYGANLPVIIPLENIVTFSVNTGTEPERVSEGWHTIYGRTVYVEHDKIIRGTKENGTLPAYVYRYSKKYRCWTREDSITVSAFRSGIKRGTIDLK